MRDQPTSEPLVRSLLERIELQFRSILTEQLDLAAKAHTAAFGEGHAAAQFAIDESPSTVRSALRSSPGRQSSVKRSSGGRHAKSPPDQLQFRADHVYLSGSVLNRSQRRTQQLLNSYSSLPSEHYPVRLQSLVRLISVYRQNS